MDSYDILNVTRESSDKEIETAYLDLKRKYDPSFNTSIHAYKKYREICKAYEDIKDEQRRKMYALKEDVEEKHILKKEYELFDFDREYKAAEEAKVIDYTKVENYDETKFKDIELNVEVSYLYKLLNLRYDLEYSRKVKCSDCSSYVVCSTCGGEKVVEYKNHLVWCPICQGEGNVSSRCNVCGDSGFNLVKENVSFYIDNDFIELKGYGDEYGSNLKSNLKVFFNFYDKDNISVKDDIIEVSYYLSEEETLNGLKKDFISEIGAFSLEVPRFVEDGYIQSVNFNNKKIIFTFFNEKYNGEDIIRYLFINRSYKNKFIYFNDDYSVCSKEEAVNCSKLVKCESLIVVEDFGKKGKYGGNNGNLIIHVEFTNDDELLYLDNVRIVETSKLFNLLGGRIAGIYHYGFKKSNSLVKKNNIYYLLKGNSSEKEKLKNYFLFKIICLLLWCLIPLLILFIPYNKTMFIILIGVFLAYLILINILMEVEV